MQFIEAWGRRVRYLPPYAPDLDPIDLAFSKMKKLLRGGTKRTIDALWQLCGNVFELLDEAERLNSALRIPLRIREDRTDAPGR